MKKSFKTVGILLSIMSLAACENKLSEEYKDITKEKAYTHLNKIVDYSEKKTPRQCSFLITYQEKEEYSTGFKSNDDTVMWDYTSYTEINIDLDNYFITETTYSTYRKLKEGERYPETLSGITDERYYYLRDNGVFYTVTNYQVQSKNEQDTVNNKKEYKTGILNKSEFEKNGKKLMKDRFIINSDTDKKAFFDLLVDDVFMDTTPCNNRNIPVTSRYETFMSRGNASSLAYVCSDRRVINKNEIDDQLLVNDDKDKVNKIEYNGTVTLELSDYLYGVGLGGSLLSYYNSDNQIYKHFETTQVTHVNKTAEIKYPDLTGYKQVQQ